MEASWLFATHAMRTAYITRFYPAEDTVDKVAARSQAVMVSLGTCVFRVAPTELFV